MANTKKSLSCISCGLRDGEVLTPKMEPYGEFLRKILIIGEAPGKVEDRKGKPWQGRTGRLLQRTLAKLGIRLFEDCLSLNAVNCRPPNNRAPSPFEIDCCREVLVKDTINKHKPKVIILLGSSAVRSFLGDRWPKDLGGIMKWRGWAIPDQDFGAWVVPTFHPSYVSRIDSREANTIWEQDFLLADRVAGRLFPKMEEPPINFIKDLDILYDLENVEKVAIDYETTGLKPKIRGQRIICAGITAGTDKVYAFLMPKTKAEREPFVHLMTSEKVGKMAHNLKFEHNWTLNRYGVETKNWIWDSMLAAHQLDNRTGVTGLKFQTYANFGVIIKDDDVGKYIYESENGFNRVYELLEEPGGQEKLLRHVALDSYYEYLLAQRQRIEMDVELPF